MRREKLGGGPEGPPNCPPPLGGPAGGLPGGPPAGGLPGGPPVGGLPVDGGNHLDALYQNQRV